MITPFQNPEEKNEKASNFWTNLTGKLGLSAPLMREASAAEQKEQRLSDGIQVHGAHKREAALIRASDAAVTKVSAQDNELLSRYAGVFQRAVAELGQSERVKAADRLSRIEADMAAFREKVLGLGGEKEMVDLCGEIGLKSDAISGSCVQLRNKVDSLSTAQAEAIENAFLVLSDAKTCLDKMGPAGMAAPMEPGMSMEMGLGAGDEIEGDIPEMPEFDQDEEKHDHLTAGRRAWTRKAADVAYDDLRLIHTKLCLVDSMLASLVAESNVGAMLAPEPMSAGAPPAGMPPMEEMDGEQEMGLAELGARCKGRMSAFAAFVVGRHPEGVVLNTPEYLLDEAGKEMLFNSIQEAKEFLRSHGETLDDAQMDEAYIFESRKPSRKASVKTAASGDPGDTEPGNTIYKDLGKCRDCVWFESDWTHETYRDKCKHCTHAALGGAIEHFWPKSQQMVMWIPAWSAPEAKAKKAFVGTLGLTQTAKTASAAALHIASDIVASAAHTAIDLGTEFVAYFADPVVARSMPLIAGEVAAEIEKQTGIQIAITAEKARAWGHKKLAAVRVPADYEVQPLKPGENVPGKATCGACNLSWDDNKITSMTPAPSARCPFEAFHAEEAEVPERGLGRNAPDSALGIGGTASANGEVVIACDATLVHLAKGEKRKIKELREKLHNEKRPAKIKELNDAIDSLYSRMDSDKERREQSRTQREEKRKKSEEAADSEHAKMPEATTAKFVGTLGLKVAYDPHAKEQPESAEKEFKVVAVSSNTNSFGLYGVVMLAKDGEAWKAAANSLNAPKQGDTLKIDTSNWASKGFEIPEKLPQAPKNVVAEVWGKQASAGRSL